MRRGKGVSSPLMLVLLISTRYQVIHCKRAARDIKLNYYFAFGGGGGFCEGIKNYSSKMGVKRQNNATTKTRKAPIFLDTSSLSSAKRHMKMAMASRLHVGTYFFTPLPLFVSPEINNSSVVSYIIIMAKFLLRIRLYISFLSYYLLFFDPPPPPRLSVYIAYAVT